MKITIELPSRYYLDHFREFLSALNQQCSGLLLDEHHRFLLDFSVLSQEAQCLYVRMVNRKGRLFQVKDLVYQEIPNLSSVVLELSESQFVRKLQKEDLPEFFTFLTKAQALKLLIDKSLKIKKTLPRTELIPLLAKEVSEVPAAYQEEILVQDRTEEMQYLLFLYFGRIQSNLSLYTLRDLGIRKTNSYQGGFKSRFRNREEARTHYFYAQLAHALDKGEKLPPMESWPHAASVEAEVLRHQILLVLGEEAKKEQDFILSLTYFEACECHPARERRARLLYQLGKKDECQTLLQEILDNPWSDEECFFAEDYFARKFQKKKISLLTEILRDSSKLRVDESYFRHPELAVIENFKLKGSKAFHVENYLWCSLFGLFFWEELFESEKSGLHNPFERYPSDLANKTFYSKHLGEISLKLQLFDDRPRLLECLKEKASLKENEINGLFSWYPDTWENLELFLSHAPMESVKTMLVYMAQDYGERSSGFPDLIVLENNEIIFYEIKAQGDSLKSNQLKQILSLKKAGFRVEILQVEYAFNPEQCYVIVDLETTGMGPGHRVTEIGAVKIQGEKVIDVFQTLINPERSIPKNIQALTGITNEMVKEAPVFSAIAENFETFCQNAIFVAHNVNFDYKFIQSEFERLEKKFVRPFICTKSGMKKYYPGLDSYSLSHLTQTFSIPLKNHHRALCDAEAAAGLLLLINQKRRESEIPLDLTLGLSILSQEKGPIRNLSDMGQLVNHNEENSPGQ